MSSEIHDLSSAELSGLLASRKLSPVERAEDEAAVEAAKFAPVGNRGMFTSCGIGSCGVPRRESGRLRHVEGPTDEATAAGGW